MQNDTVRQNIFVAFHFTKYYCRQFDISSHLYAEIMRKSIQCRVITCIIISTRYVFLPKRHASKASIIYIAISYWCARMCTGKFNLLHGTFKLNKNGLWKLEEQNVCVMTLSWCLHIVFCASVDCGHQCKDIY